MRYWQMSLHTRLPHPHHRQGVSKMSGWVSQSSQPEDKTRGGTYISAPAARNTCTEDMAEAILGARRNEDHTGRAESVSASLVVLYVRANGYSYHSYMVAYITCIAS